MPHKRRRRRHRRRFSSRSHFGASSCICTYERARMCTYVKQRTHARTHKKRSRSTTTTAKVHVCFSVCASSERSLKARRHIAAKISHQAHTHGATANQRRIHTVRAVHMYVYAMHTLEPTVCVRAQRMKNAARDGGEVVMCVYVHRTAFRNQPAARGSISIARSNMCTTGVHRCGAPTTMSLCDGKLPNCRFGWRFSCGGRHGAKTARSSAHNICRVFTHTGTDTYMKRCRNALAPTCKFIRENTARHDFAHHCGARSKSSHSHAHTQRPTNERSDAN